LVKIPVAQWHYILKHGNHYIAESGVKHNTSKVAQKNIGQCCLPPIRPRTYKIGFVKYT
jgi:hypothetical protein